MIKNTLEKAKILYKAEKEKALFICALFLVSITALWVLQTPKDVKSEKEENTELGLSIPEGMLVVPLELTNGKAILNMITRFGVIDVFLEPRHFLVARNLKVLRLSTDEAPYFGALVPEAKSSQLQNLFSQKNLQGALKKYNSGTAEFFQSFKKQNPITSISVEDSP